MKKIKFILFAVLFMIPTIVKADVAAPFLDDGIFSNGLIPLMILVAVVVIIIVVTCILVKKKTNGAKKDEKK